MSLAAARAFSSGTGTVVVTSLVAVLAFSVATWVWEAQ